VSHAYKGPNVAARNAIAALLDRAWLFPRRGQHVGARASEGPPIAATWDGNGAPPFGWSSFQAHRVDQEGTLWLPEPETTAELARLTPGEQGQLAAARAQAEPHALEAKR
jgi:hypothetical protein